MGLRTAGVPMFAGTVFVGIVLVGVLSGCGGASLAVPDTLVPLGPTRRVNIEQASSTTVVATTTTISPVPPAGPTTTSTEVFFVLDAPLTATTVETADTIPLEDVLAEAPNPDEVLVETSLLEPETTMNLDGTASVEGVEPAPTTVLSPANEGG